MRSWYCVYTKPRQEQTALDNLSRLQVETYFPLTVADKRFQRRNHEKFRFLLPRYGFVRMEPGIDDFYVIRSTYGVSGMVKLNGEDIDGYHYTTPTPVAEGIIIALQQAEDDQGIRRFKSDYERGDPVLITQGVYEGIRAIIDAVPQKRPWILFSMMGKPVRLQVTYEMIQPVTA